MVRLAQNLLILGGDIGKVHFINNAYFDPIPPQERGIWVSKDLPPTLPAGEGVIGITITFCSNGGMGEANDSLQLIFCHSSYNMYCRWAYFGSWWYGWIKLN